MLALRLGRSPCCSRVAAAPSRAMLAKAARASRGESARSMVRSLAMLSRSSSASAEAESLEDMITHATQQSQQFGSNGTRFVYQRPPEVHATAVVHPNAELGPNVQIGPYSVVGPEVELEAGVCLQSHVVVDGRTRIGCDTVVHPFASLGGEPQDKKHRSSVRGDNEGDLSLSIGQNCVIREHVTVHGSTSYMRQDAPTTVGDDCWLLCGAHVGHDAHVGRRVVVSNNVCIAGHVNIGDAAIIGGQVGIKQFANIGRLAMVGGQSAVDGDVLPYGLVVGNRAMLAGLNLIGLRRARVSRDNIKLLLRVYRYLFGAPACKRTGFAPALDLAYRETIEERAAEVKHYLMSEGLDIERRPLAHEMVDFVLDSPQRFRSSLCQAVISPHKH